MYYDRLVEGRGGYRVQPILQRPTFYAAAAHCLLDAHALPLASNPGHPWTRRAPFNPGSGPLLNIQHR